MEFARDIADRVLKRDGYALIKVFQGVGGESSSPRCDANSAR